MFKKLGILAMFCFLGGVTASAYFTWVFPSQKLAITEPIIFEIPRGAGPKKIAAAIKSSGMQVEHFPLSVWLRLGSKFNQIKAGTYRVETSLSLHEVFDMLKEGKVYRPLALKFNIPEGSNTQTIFAKLVADGVGSYQELVSLSKNREFLKSLQIDAGTVEGYLYPATYYFYDQLPTAKQAVSRFVKEFFKRIDKPLISRFTEKGLNLQKAITFASLIEKETLSPEERPKIAEVIWNRLKKKEPLGIDAAIIYGIEDYDGDITWKHLRDKSNKYNTRVHKGLPPTPISSPTLESVKAVLNPTQKGYYYFVRKPGAAKKHHFSKSYREHAKYVEKWVKATKR